MKALLTTALLITSFSSLANDGWKYVEPDAGYHSGYSIVKDGSTYIRHDGEGYTHVSNVPCKYIVSVILNGSALSSKCIRNQWGNWEMKFPTTSNKHLSRAFNSGNEVTLKFIYADNSSSTTNYPTQQVRNNDVP